MISIMTAILCITSLGGLTQYGANTPRPDMQGGNDRAGTVYVLKADQSAEQRQRRLAEIREKLWQQWQAHQSAEVRVVEQGPAGESHTTYMVEPDGGGLWQMTIKTKGVVSDPWYPAQKYPQKMEYHVYNVERIVPPRNAHETPTHPPADAKLPADSYQLMFRDKSGGHVQSL